MERKRSGLNIQHLSIKMKTDHTCSFASRYCSLERWKFVCVCNSGRGSLFPISCKLTAKRDPLIEYCPLSKGFPHHHPLPQKRKDFTDRKKNMSVPPPPPPTLALLYSFKTSICHVDQGFKEVNSSEVGVVWNTKPFCFMDKKCNKIFTVHHFSSDCLPAIN